jgi:chromate reductase
MAQQHLRQILGVLGALVMGGEAYITYKPGLVDDAGMISDGRTRAFLKNFVDQFAALLTRFSSNLSQPPGQAAT